MDLSVDSLPNHTNDLSGYYFENTTKGTNSGWIQTNFWQDTELSCGTEYAYTVKYRNGDGTETDTTSLTKSANPCGTCVVFGVPASPIIQEESIVQEIEKQEEQTQEQEPQPINAGTTIVMVQQQIINVLQELISLYTQLIAILKK